MKSTNKNAVLLISIILAGCYSAEDTKKGLLGSWEYFGSNAERPIGCIEHAENQRVFSFLGGNNKTVHQFAGYWHAFRGLRIQHHVGKALVDDNRKTLPLEEVTGWRRVYFNITSLRQDSFTMRDRSGDKFRAVRAESCDSFLARFDSPIS